MSIPIARKAHNNKFVSSSSDLKPNLFKSKKSKYSKNLSQFQNIGKVFLTFKAKKAFT